MISKRISFPDEAKPIVWLGSSLRDLRACPPDARARFGHALHQVQLGIDPGDWRPMPTVCPGAREIRVQTGRAFRVIYVSHEPDAIYVLHVFEKKTRQTRQHDIELARDRWQRRKGVRR